MARLGLDDRKDEHKQLYTMMKVGSIFPLTGANFTSLICFAGRKNH
jgi:hypothetical protein